MGIGKDVTDNRILFFTFIVLVSIIPLVSAQQWCGVQNLYIQDIPSEVGSFNQITNYPSGNPIVDDNVTITSSSGIVPITSYLSVGTFPGEGVTLYPGLVVFNIYDYAISQPSYLSINVSKYNVLTGNESPYYNLSSIAISANVSTKDQTYHVSITPTTFDANERLLVRVGAYTTSPTATTIHFLNQGNTPTYIQSGYFNCPEQPTDYSTEATAAAFGAVGSFMLVLLLSKRRREK